MGDITIYQLSAWYQSRGWEKLFQHTFAGTPVPFFHMTQQSKWTMAAQNYLGYQRAIADFLRAHHPDLILPEAPPTTMRKERALYNKLQKQKQYVLLAASFFAKDMGDSTNGLKTVEDAIQKAGIIWNDKTIAKSFGERFVDPENPRVEFVLLRRSVA